MLVERKGCAPALQEEEVKLFSGGESLLREIIQLTPRERARAVTSDSVSQALLMLHPNSGPGQKSAEVSTTVYSASKSVLKSVGPGKPASGTGTGANTILIEDASMSGGGGSQMLGALAEVNSESANSTSSLFERTPFQDFTSRKFNEILSQHDFSSLI